MSSSVRTQEIAVAEVRFGIQFGLLNERFWGRIDTLLNFLQVLAGAFALAGVLADGVALGVAGASMAVISALQLVLQPGRRAADFRVARRAWHELFKHAWALSLHELDARIEDLRAESPVGLRALEQPALNDIERMHGHEPTEKLTLMQRLAVALA